MKLLKVAIGS